MSLQPLEWRKLPARIFPANMTATSSYFLDTIYDMLTGSFYSDGSARVVGSGSAWQMPTKFVTGSNTEAVYVFPGFQTVMSQSVIFACKSKTGAVSTAAVPVIYGSRTSAAYGNVQHRGSSGPVVFSTGSIYAALVKNASGSFTQWTSLYPFGSGSYSTGYASVTPLPAALDTLVIYESKEAIAVITQTAVTDAQVYIAGALIDPEQTTSSTDAEIDNRLYSVVSAAEMRGAYSNYNAFTSFPTNFLTNTDAFNNPALFLHANDYNDSINQDYQYYRTGKFVTFRPQENSFLGTYQMKFVVNTFGTPNPIDINIESPIKCIGDNNIFLGRLREIVGIKNRSNNETLRDPNNKIIGYTLSRYDLSQNHAVCLKY
jgi:hypothetical protein